ncbi:MAG: GNAT family N-acetyltransferase [Patescibacteria group bacterium]|nr:GNAT family N-acetyltransferase [Patescibacteria group bacterium]
MKIKIKKAKIENLNLIQKLNYEVFEASLSYDKHLDMSWPFNEKGIKYFKEALISKDYCCLLAYDGNFPVGYLIGTERNFSYRKNKVGEIDNMGVTKKYRGKGVGTALINEFKKWCQKRGLTQLRVSTYFKYDKAINFYKKQGLKEMDLVLEGEI